MTIKQFFEANINESIAGGLYDLYKELPVPEWIDGFRVPKLSDMMYGQMLELRQGFVDAVDDHDIALLIGRVMLEKDADAFPCDEFLPYMMAVMEFVEERTKTENKKLKYTPTAGEKAAGIDKLSVFKEWGTIDEIAQRMKILHDDVLKLRYNDVFLMQWKDLEQRKFERRYHKWCSKNAGKE
jgi:hypothetical protein